MNVIIKIKNVLDISEYWSRYDECFREVIQPRCMGLECE
jgi:hypothetical protein